MRAQLLKRILTQTAAGPLPFEFTVNTANTSTGSSTSTQFKLPLVSAGTYNMTVNWGDGNSDTITTWNAAATTHTYSASGTYTITITGTCAGWRFINTGDKLKILDILSWGILDISSPDSTRNEQFFGCTNLKMSATDAPTVSGSLFRCFYGCSSMYLSTGNFSAWNTASVTSMTQMFYGCNSYNPAGLENWNTSLVTGMVGMFSSTTFNRNIGAWNVSSCTDFTSMFYNNRAFNNAGSNTINNWVIKSTGTVNMAYMFDRAQAFNQPIGNWNVSRVTSMNTMLGGAAFPCQFNQDISGWNVGNVTDMSSMFRGNAAFNQNIGSWNVSKVTNFTNFCLSASSFNNGGSADINNWSINTTVGAAVSFQNMFSGTAFNQPINSWDVSEVTTMSNMLGGCPFNQPLNSWNTGKVVSMGGMFRANGAFNQDIGSWNTANVTDMASMFYNFGVTSPQFNNGGSSSINNWNTSKVTDMNSMFSYTPFNQPIGNWDVSKVTNMYRMFWNATSFNQNLSSWNTSKVTSVEVMFQSATAFDQNIGSWNLSLCTVFTNFMSTKTNLTFSTTNLDAIYNGWIAYELSVSEAISFGTAKYTAAATAGRALLTRTNTTINVTGTADNGGLIRVTATGHGRSTGDKVFIKSVGGTTNANGLWTVTVVDANTLELQGSIYNAAWTSGGTVRTGYGWTIQDGGV